MERKPKGQKGDWLRTVVAFANSTPIGYPAVLFIGVDDSGKIVDDLNCEQVMKSFCDIIESQVWPPVYTLPRSLEHQGKSCVAVIVPGSSERPHFAGRSYVRVGTQTKEASEQQFAELIAQRNGKTRELLAWMGKPVTQVLKQPGVHGYSESRSTHPVFLETCNSNFVTLKYRPSGAGDLIASYALNRIELSFDHNQSRLEIHIYGDR